MHAGSRSFKHPDTKDMFSVVFFSSLTNVVDMSLMKVKICLSGVLASTWKEAWQERPCEVELWRRLSPGLPAASAPG